MPRQKRISMKYNETKLVPNGVNVPNCSFLNCREWAVKTSIVTMDEIGKVPLDVCPKHRDLILAFIEKNKTGQKELGLGEENGNQGVLA